MNKHNFLYASFVFVLYGLYLKRKREKYWIKTNGIINKVKTGDTIINDCKGGKITEVISYADVVYTTKNNDYITTNVKVSRSIPLQIGNTVKLEYNEYDMNNNIKYDEVVIFGVLLILIYFSFTI